MKKIRYYFTYFSKRNRDMRRALKILEKGDCSIFMSENNGKILASTYSNDVAEFTENKLIWFKKHFIHVDKHMPDNKILIVNKDYMNINNYLKPYKPIVYNQINA